MSRIDKIYCVRFIRLPPSSVQLSTPFDLALSITDDVGSPVPEYGTLPLRLQCFCDDFCQNESSDFELVHQSSKASAFSIDSSSTTFHSFKAVLRRKGSTKSPLRSFRLGVSYNAERTACAPPVIDTPVLRLVGEGSPFRLVSLEESVTLLRTCTSPIKMVPNFVNLSKDKVRNTEVVLYPPQTALSPIRIMERPSLHVIGDHVWHSSLVLASYIYSDVRDVFTSNNIETSQLFIELGAGCGIISLALAAKLGSASCRRSASIISTDLPEIVESTLAESLAANPNLGKQVHAEALRWGQGPEALPPLLLEHTGDVVVVASDVLYNHESHRDFLKTLLVLFETCKGRAQAYITYKRRVEGDEGWFPMAREAGLYLKVVYTFADVQVWLCLPPTSALQPELS